MPSSSGTDPGFRLREMTEADLPATLEVRLSTRENAITERELEQNYGVTPDRLARAMRGNVRGWLCETAGRVAGFSMGNSATGQVLVVAVHPDFEGQGIGKCVLTAVCDWLFAAGHEELWLGANPDPNIRATGFYRKFGWQATGRMTGDDAVLVLRRPGRPDPAAPLTKG